MLLLISPAKALDESPAPTGLNLSQAEFLPQAEVLMSVLKPLGSVDIQQLMGLSEKLAELNYERFQAWQLPFDVEVAKQALWLFKGDVYQGIDALTLDADAVTYCQTHLRILSGLYGLLKPLDAILPYRLEMGTALTTAKGKNLYAYWGEQLTQALNQQLAQQKSRWVVNLASNEYFKAIQPKQLQAEVITPQFKEWKNGRYKIISFYAKRARGLMARYAAENLLTDPEGLKHFDWEGYQFAADLSSEKDWVFTRKQA